MKTFGRQDVLVGSLFVGLCLLGAGCASYSTPGSGANLSSLAGVAARDTIPGGKTSTDATVSDIMQRHAAASFPARLAVVRVQGAGYRSYTSQGYGSGKYTVISTRDVERDEDYERLSKLPMVAGVAPINRILLPAQLDSIKELQEAAAQLQADMLIVYTFDTHFRVQDHDIGPLGPIALGFIGNQEAHVTTTASAVIFDVRTGYVYGLVEATKRHSQKASHWTSQEAIETSRLKTESESFQAMLSEVEKVWREIIAKHLPTAAR